MPRIMLWASRQANPWMLRGDKSLQDATVKIVGAVKSNQDAARVDKQTTAWVCFLSSCSLILIFSIGKAVVDG